MFGLLQVVDGPDKGRSFPVPQGKTVQIGRGQRTAVGLNDPQVSRIHCQINLEGANALLTDSGSVGGTWVNGERVTQHLLQPGDIIRVGETQFSFQWSHSDEKPTEAWESATDLRKKERGA
jgi:pSer/pThr/pTyr-binding forkhead associated (FHA) protein